jgi:NADPH:quinone reductase-like Zn-dependent oxidoreductase
MAGMKVFQIQDDWGMEHLRLASRPDPRRPRPGAAAHEGPPSSTTADLVVPMRGYGSHTGTLPLIPLSDGVGEVVEAGAGVTRARARRPRLPALRAGLDQRPPTPERLSRSLGGRSTARWPSTWCCPKKAS